MNIYLENRCFWKKKHFDPCFFSTVFFKKKKHVFKKKKNRTRFFFKKTLIMETPKVDFFSKKFEIEFCLYPDFLYAKKRNRPGFVDVSPTLVIDMSTKRYLRVLQHRNQKIFLLKKFEIELYFDLCWRAEINIQVGRNMYLYVDIGDALSSLWGSTSSIIKWWL